MRNRGKGKLEAGGWKGVLNLWNTALYAVSSCCFPLNTPHSHSKLLLAAGYPEAQAVALAEVGHNTRPYIPGNTINVIPATIHIPLAFIAPTGRVFPLRHGGQTVIATRTGIQFT